MDYVKVPNITIDLGQKVMELCDELVFQALEPFGITKENCRDYKGRIAIYYEGLFQHYFVDGFYAFTLCYNISGMESVSYSIKILESMKGWICNVEKTGV